VLDQTLLAVGSRPAQRACLLVRGLRAPSPRFQPLFSSRRQAPLCRAADHPAAWNVFMQWDSFPLSKPSWGRAASVGRRRIKCDHAGQLTRLQHTGVTTNHRGSLSMLGDANEPGAYSSGPVVLSRVGSLAITSLSHGLVCQPELWRDRPPPMVTRRRSAAPSENLLRACQGNGQMSLDAREDRRQPQAPRGVQQLTVGQ